MRYELVWLCDLAWQLFSVVVNSSGQREERFICQGDYEYCLEVKARLEQ
jgi:hypothetical protein